MHNASRIAELAVASILFLVALTGALQLIGSTSFTIRQVDHANQVKDRNVRSTMEPIRSKPLTGADVILFISQLRENVELEVEGMSVKSPILLEDIQFNSISRTKQYHLHIERNEDGDIRKMIFR
ncbi:hypothetical protein M3661_11560 [Paenibacillus sp. MER 180]|uniref:Uncharacterized protein n=1 Tax=Paenibacillus popilliae TaxID=78057 RepID=A0ABY3AW17_PAEPP|nr:MULTISPECIES: hypothetical protein [unclassified Paenibacillus]MCM3290769.1 hypothetical protein [Paenibacillus sp. MER 180]OBY79646.1 hypothetical protein BBG47_10380 [Paenibacillus sp. KS1]TQR46705.1 hypothetical protein C7Y44_03350 [Paenibacillus sp. SDF0028]